MRYKKGRFGRAAVGTLLFASVVWAAAAAGSLDTSFDGDGIATTAAMNGYVRAVATQSDGKVLVGGNDAEGAGAGWKLRRYGTGGSIDTSFGTNGVVELFGAGTADTIFDIAVDAQDGIYLLGVAGHEETVTTGKGKKQTTTTVVRKKSTVTRLGADGAIDNGFGTNGSVAIDLPDRQEQPWHSARNIALAGGRLIVSGQTSIITGKGRNKNITGAIALVKLHASDGAFDTAFDGDGIVIDSMNGTVDNMRMALAVDSNGAIYTAHWTDSSDWNVVKHSSSGVRDSNYAGSSPANGAYIQDLAVDGSDRVIAIGNVGTGDDRDGIVARYDTDGDLDSGFGTSGSTVSGIANWDLFFRVSIDSNGIYALGAHRANGIANVELDAIVMRFDSGGDADANFGSESVSGLGEPVRPGGVSEP
ncbi:MAG: NHL repeat-containing protein, partial [Planctomycetota bacterium]